MLHVSRMPSMVSYSAAICACEKGRQWEEALQLLQEMPHRLLLPSLICYSAAALACEAGVNWKQALRMLHHMHVFSCDLDKIGWYRCQKAPNSSGTPRISLVRQPCASCSNIQDYVPHAVFRCPGLIMVHKPPGWEVGAQDLTTANSLCI